MSKRGSTTIWLFCLALFSSTGFAQAPGAIHELSIQQAVEYAHKNNVQVKNALLDISIQQQSNRDITSAALPSVTGSIGATDYLKIPTSLLPGEVFGQPRGTYIPVQFGTKYNSTASIQLQQLLFDGQVFIGLQARATSLEWRKKSAEVTEEAIKTNIYKIYYQLVVSKTQIALLDANINRLNKLDHDTRELYKNGFAEKLDLDKIAVQVANLQTEKTKALNNIDIGYLGLKTLMGMPIKDSLVLTEKITDDQIKEDFTNDSSYQYFDRKEFQYLQLAKKLNEFNIKRYKLSYFPTLSLTGAYSKNAQRNEFDFFGKGDWFTTSYVGLNISIPIFDGFAKDSRIKKSRMELTQTNNQIDNLQLSIDNEVAQARINFRSAISTMNYQKKNMDLAEDVYNQTKKKYEIGSGSNTEITSAQTDLVTAQTNYINALYTAIIAKVDYLKAIGKL
ncbi:Outer membrane protein TolC [Hydrobacter penzbergensis]|uniref:Outer membrane protein TolC n=1 Tax=Hydrobacter penzbergensis TaxID=1235997 RepID=A0A8X8LCT8_9BACT|nr:TolC family protein [Hydrobacter penzbergensis]SDX58238.1 Outer membrane protein TolC [Hydrobacter penzbergensis]